MPLNFPWKRTRSPQATTRAPAARSVQHHHSSASASGAGSAAGRGEDAELLQALEQSALEHALAESRRTAGRSARDAPLEPSGRPDSAEEGPPAVVQEPAAGPGTAAWRLAEDERLARLLQQNEVERQRLQAARVSLSLGKGSEAAEEGEAGGADRAAGGGRAAAAPPAGPPQQAAEWPWAALSEAAVAEATAAPAHPAPASDGRSADRPQQQQRAASGPVSLGQSADTSSDEALARALQMQLDLEARAAAGGGIPAQGPGPSPQQPHGAAPGALPAGQPAPLGPSSTPAGPPPAGPAGPAGMHAAPWPPPAPPPPPQSKPPLHQLGEHLGAALSLGDAGCAECGGYIAPWDGSAAVGGRRWHQRCLRCAVCGRALGARERVAVDGAGQPAHYDCHRERLGLRCRVCRHFMPTRPDGVTEYSVTPFWGERSCPAHQADGTPACCGCSQLKPASEAWAELADGRQTCLACLQSIVTDTADAQPLYSQVLAFYERLGMPLPQRVPLMLVDGPCLNEAVTREGQRLGGPTFHTRGLTLCQEYRQLRTVQRTPSRGASDFFQVQPAFVDVPAAAHYEVTAILVLFALPWLLTGSILAHELMHAWLRLSGLTGLSLDVEEGLCQLLALLWLEQQPAEPEGTWEERLSSFFAHQIRSDPSPVYGDGLRTALDAFQRLGLPALLAHVRSTGAIPLPG